MDDNIIVTCAGCGMRFEIPLWQFELDIEEGVDEWFCAVCYPDGYGIAIDGES